MYQVASDRLKKAGFAPIGLDHFSKVNNSMFKALKSKKLKRNFQGYSTDKGTSIIGFGASAIGYLPLGYVQNTLDFEEYKKNILNEILPIKKGIRVSKDDKLRKKVIDEIMCFLEVDLNKIIRDFNLPENYFFDEINALQELERDGLIKTKNNKIKINPQTRQIARVVSSFFDKFFKHDNKKHSKIAQSKNIILDWDWCDNSNLHLYCCWKRRRLGRRLLIWSEEIGRLKL